MFDKKFIDFIKAGQLVEAIGYLRSKCDENTYNLVSRIDEIEMIYHRLVGYYIDGTQDEGRQEAYDYIVNELVRINDLINIKKADYFNHSKLYQLRRVSSGVYNNMDFPSILVSLKEEKDRTVYDKYINQLFEKSLSETLAGDDIELLLNFPSEYETMVIVSAFSLGLVEIWDENKFKYLLQKLCNPNLSNDLLVRVLIGCIMAITSFPIHVDLELKTFQPIWKLALEINPSIVDCLKEIIYAHELSRLTKTISGEITDKLEKNIKNLRQEGIKSVADLENMDDLPEWVNHRMSKSMEKDLQKFQSMQDDGVDVSYTSFQGMKGNPFFNEIANWFLPFTKEHSLIASELKNNPVLVTILKLSMSTMCDADAFGLALTWKYTVNQDQLNIFGDKSISSSSFEAMLSEVEGLKPDVPSTLRSSALNYVRVLYRFYNCSFFKSDFTNFFENHLDLKLPLLGPICNDLSTLHYITDFFFKFNFYQDALPILEYMVKIHPEGAIFEKIGFIYEINKEYKQAVDHYSKAYLYSSESYWLLSHLGQCYLKLKNYKKAKQILLQALQLKNMKPTILLKLAEIMVYEKDYKEAISTYQRYLNSDKKYSAKAMRGLSWCYYMEKNPKKALQIGYSYIKMIEEHDPNKWNDYLNLGHYALANHLLTKAVEYYEKSILSLKETENAWSTFNEHLISDKKTLKLNKVGDKDIRFVREMLLVKKLDRY